MWRFKAFVVLATVTVATHAFSRCGHGAPITYESLIVYRVGDGSAPLTDAAAPVFLDTFEFNGTHRDTIPVPSSGPNALTATGNDPSEGAMSRSLDRRAFHFTGYRKDAGGSNPAADAGDVTARVAANLRLSGVLDTSVAVVDAPNGAIRSSASEDGSAYWLGTAGGIRYVGAPGGAASSVEIDGHDARQVRIATGQSLTSELFASNAAPETAAKMQNYGGLPTGQTVGSPVISLTTSDVANAFVLLDYSPVAGQEGADLLYVLSTNEGLLRKYLLEGGNWTPKGSIATSATHMTGFLRSSLVHIFLTTPTELQRMTDSVGLDLPNDDTSLTTIATADANTAFRGVEFTFERGIPEPSSLVLAVLGCLTARMMARSQTAGRLV